MTRRHFRLLVPALMIITAAFWWGCAQPENIISEKSTTVIHLTAERLPTTPPGMTYQLWAADTMIVDSLYGARPVDEAFTYRFEGNRYMEVDGSVRADSNRFQFAGDILSYQWIFLSVQLAGGGGPMPGPVMLMDTVTPTDYSELILVLPLSDSMWFSAVEMNMETPSDGKIVDNIAYDTIVDTIGDTTVVVDTAWRTDPEVDGAGIWFTVYSERVWTAQDTISLDAAIIETLPPQDEFTIEDGECVDNVVNIFDPVLDTVTRIYGFDTISWQAITYSTEEVRECDSGQGNLFKTKVTLVYSTLPADSGVYDDFTQVAVNLPDLRRMGWVYRGWVTSSVISNLEVGVGEITPPAWVGLNQVDSTIHGIGGVALLSTGKFHSLYEPDYGNPYVDTAIRVPPYPGEDFLKNLPGGKDIEVNLVPGGRTTGSIFIALHPSNALTDTTNFPLIVQIRDIPSSRFLVQEEDQQFQMTNMSHHTTFGMGTRTGLPQVRWTIERF